MRVLLVEDDQRNVEFISEVLEGDGHEVVVERDGSRGRDRALVERFDLIVLDMQLPGMQGDLVCGELRTAGYSGPILALSAAALQDQVERAMSAGFDSYLTKPISPPALRAAVRRYGQG